MKTTTTALLCLLVCCWYVDDTRGTDPGMKIRLSQSSLDYAADIAVEKMSAKLHGASLPNVVGSSGIIKYEVTNMKVSLDKKPSSSVNINPGRGLTWTLSRADITVRGNWRYKLFFIKDSGSFRATATGVSLSVSVILRATGNGQPTIRATGCRCDISRLKIRLSGGASWFYNLFMGIVARRMRGRLEKKVCDAARKVVNVNADTELSTMPMSFQLGPQKQWLLDYRLSSVKFASDYLESCHKGEFSIRGKSTRATLQPSLLPIMTTNNRMVTYWISDYVFNTFGYVLHKSGIVHYTLKTRNLPRNYVGETFLRSFVEMEASMTESPVTVISEQNLVIRFVGSLALRARLPNGSLADLFDIKVVLNVSVVPRIDQRRLKATVTSIDETVTLASSSVGAVPVDLLTFFFRIVKQQFIIPSLNKAGKSGIPIPAIKHVQFLNPQLLLEKNAVKIATDVRYQA